MREVKLILGPPELPRLHYLVDECAKLIARGVPYECSSIVAGIGERRVSGWGQLVWVPSEERAGISVGGDACWTDAESPEDALDLYNRGELRE